jgi:hypothetical protein
MLRQLLETLTLWKMRRELRKTLKKHGGHYD